MTYFEKLFEVIEYIANRHKNAIETLLDEDVKESIYSHNNTKEVYIKFNKHQLPEYMKSDYEYLYFNAPIVTIDIKFDLETITLELNLPKPEFCNGVAGDPNDVGGFIIRIPEGWNEKFKNKEYEEREESLFWWRDWKCTDEHFKERYKHFNETIKRFLK